MFYIKLLIEIFFLSIVGEKMLYDNKSMNKYQITINASQNDVENNFLIINPIVSSFSTYQQLGTSYKTTQVICPQSFTVLFRCILCWISVKTEYCYWYTNPFMFML